MEEPRKKILLIGSCWDCCHRDKMADVLWCRLKQRQFKGWIVRKLPRWCPLPWAPKEQPTKKGKK